MAAAAEAVAVGLDAPEDRAAVGTDAVVPQRVALVVGDTHLAFGARRDPDVAGFLQQDTVADALPAGIDAWEAAALGSARRLR